MRVLFKSEERQFSPDRCEFWQRGVIPRTSLPRGTKVLRWLHGDSEENYYRQGNRQYTPECIDYRFNDHGYRSDEFCDDERPAFLFVGCSNTLGIGLPEEQRWTSVVTGHYSTVWDRKVKQYNLGWSGTGPDHAAMIVHQCAEVLRPAAVFVLWSFVNRMTWFKTATTRVHFHPSRDANTPIAEHEAFALLSTDANAFFNYVRNYTFVRERLARLGIPLVCGNMEQFSTEMLRPYVDLDCLAGSWKRVDTARDGQHSGVRSNREFAMQMISGADRILGVSGRTGR